MTTLLQLHFAFNGPFGNEMAEQLRPLAETINQEPGFLWKVWTESEKIMKREESTCLPAKKQLSPIWKNILHA